MWCFFLLILCYFGDKSGFDGWWGFGYEFVFCVLIVWLSGFCFSGWYWWYCLVVGVLVECLKIYWCWFVCCDFWLVVRFVGDLVVWSGFV